MWSETSEIVRLEYGDTYFHAFLEMMLYGLCMSSKKTYLVINDLVHAISAKHPYTRYVPDLKVAVISEGFNAQPNYVQDKVLNRIMKIKCIPFMMRKKTQRGKHSSAVDGHLS